jgi:hypothetical protein
MRTGHAGAKQIVSKPSSASRVVGMAAVAKSGAGRDDDGELIGVRGDLTHSGG